RRPLNDEEKKAYVSNFQKNLKVSFNFALSRALEGLILSPNHLFISMIGEKNHLTSFEKASFISFFTTESAPSQELIDKIQSGELNTYKKLYDHIYTTINGNGTVSRVLTEYFLLNTAPQTQD